MINIAIEGQLLFGAFTSAIVASAFGGLWVGLIAGSLAGGLVGLLLAVFSITFLMDQIILGVVLNVLALGMTDYLYDRLMAPNPNYNTGVSFSSLKIPVLGADPDHRPGLLRLQRSILYITYLVIIAIQVGLFMHPLGTAGQGGRRASHGGRHGRHSGAVDPLPQRRTWRHGRRDRRRLPDRGPRRAASTPISARASAISLSPR